MTVITNVGRSVEGMALSLIKNAEHFNTFPYSDEFGVRTVGWGFNMKYLPGAGKAFENGISLVESNMILKSKVTRFMNIVFLEEIGKKMGKNVYAVLVDMCYNMGWEGFSKFYTFLKFLENNEIEKAVGDITLTLWYRQVGDRGVRDSLTLLAKENYYLI